MIDRRPLAVVQCVEASDVALGIESAQHFDVQLCVRAGGHNVAGNAVRDSALMLDLSLMKGIDITAEPWWPRPV